MVGYYPTPATRSLQGVFDEMDERMQEGAEQGLLRSVESEVEAMRRDLEWMLSVTRAALDGNNEVRARMIASNARLNERILHELRSRKPAETKREKQPSVPPLYDEVVPRNDPRRRASPDAVDPDSEGGSSTATTRRRGGRQYVVGGGAAATDPQPGCVTMPAHTALESPRRPESHLSYHHPHHYVPKSQAPVTAPPHSDNNQGTSRRGESLSAYFEESDTVEVKTTARGEGAKGMFHLEFSPPHRSGNNIKRPTSSAPLSTARRPVLTSELNGLKKEFEATIAVATKKHPPPPLTAAQTRFANNVADTSAPHEQKGGTRPAGLVHSSRTSRTASESVKVTRTFSPHVFAEPPRPSLPPQRVAIDPPPSTYRASEVLIPRTSLHPSLRTHHGELPLAKDSSDTDPLDHRSVSDAPIPVERVSLMPRRGLADELATPVVVPAAHRPHHAAPHVVDLPNSLLRNATVRHADPFTLSFPTVVPDPTSTIPSQNVPSMVVSHTYTFGDGQDTQRNERLVAPRVTPSIVRDANEAIGYIGNPIQADQRGVAFLTEVSFDAGSGWNRPAASRGSSLVMSPRQPPKEWLEQAAAAEEERSRTLGSAPEAYHASNTQRWVDTHIQYETACALHRQGSDAKRIDSHISGNSFSSTTVAQVGHNTSSGGDYRPPIRRMLSPLKQQQ